MRRPITGVSQRMLTQNLRELVREGVAEKRVFPESPPRVAYGLAAFGRTLEPVLVRLCEWGEPYQSRDAGSGVPREAEAVVAAK